MDKEELFELASSQEETDTRVALYAAFGKSNGYKTIRVRSPDSDVFFILLHHANILDITLVFDTGKSNLKRLINITELAESLGSRKCTATMSLHIFTGCDTTRSFKGIG